MTPTVPVLMYHSISELPPRATRRLSVHPDEFAAQLSLLRRHGYRTLTFGELGAALQERRLLPERAVVLTFDDGYADFHRHALPALETFGFTATVFVTTGWLADAGGRAAGRPLGRMLSWSQVRELHGAGIEIGAHGHSHRQLDQAPAAALDGELRLCKQLLESEVGAPVRSLAYPFGYSSARVRAAAGEAGYLFGAAVANTLIGERPDLLALPRLTVRRSTGLDSFQRHVRGEGIARSFARDRALTGGWSLVRRGRRALADGTGRR